MFIRHRSGFSLCQIHGTLNRCYEISVYQRCYIPFFSGGCGKRDRKRSWSCIKLHPCFFLCNKEMWPLRKAFCAKGKTKNKQKYNFIYLPADWWSEWRHRRACFYLMKTRPFGRIPVWKKKLIVKKYFCFILFSINCMSSKTCFRLVFV